MSSVPGKVPTVMIKDKGMTSNGIATNARQMISWDAPSNHPNIRHYLIKYGKADEVNSSSDANIMSAITQTNVTTITLMLKVPKEQTTYSVWVAAVSDAGQGEFSDRKQWSYSSGFSQGSQCYEQGSYCAHVECLHMLFKHDMFTSYPQDQVFQRVLK